MPTPDGPDTPPNLAPASIPTLSEWGMILMSLLVLGLGLLSLPRSRVR